MDTMILTLHVIACIALIVLVLLQSGKEGMGVIFGGGSQSMFGAGGAGSILTKITGFLAAVFFITSLGYNYISSTAVSGESTILDVQVQEKAPVDIEKPAAPQAEPAE